MAYRIEYAPRAKRELAALPREVQKRIVPKIDALAHDPRPPGSKKLRGFENRWRIRVGDYRVIYEVCDRELRVLVVKIGHRSDVYDYAPRTKSFGMRITRFLESRPQGRGGLTAARLSVVVITPLRALVHKRLRALLRGSLNCSCRSSRKTLCELLRGALRIWTAGSRPPCLAPGGPGLDAGLSMRDHRRDSPACVT